MTEHFDVDMAMYVCDLANKIDIIDDIIDEINRKLYDEFGKNHSTVGINPYFGTISIIESDIWQKTRYIDEYKMLYIHLLHLIDHELRMYDMHVGGKLIIISKETFECRIIFFDNGVLYQMTPSELLNEFKRLKDTLEKERNTQKEE